MPLSTPPRALSAISSLLLLGVACGDNGTASDATSQSSSDTTAGTVTAVTDSGPTAPTTQATDAVTTGATDGQTSTPVTATDVTTGMVTTGMVATDATTAELTTDTSTSTGDDTTGTAASSSSSSTGDLPCPKDQLICDGDVAKVCDGEGGYASETPCAKLCALPFGCVECLPGSTQCNGDVVQTCDDQGSAWVDSDSCDLVQGLSCDPDAGACVGACAGLGNSYIGCDYYPVVTQQLDVYVGPNNPFAAAVANTTDQPATVTITRGPNNVVTDTVAAGSVKVFKLPWVTALSNGTGPSAMVVDGAYRLRSTRPVTVYQYNPLNADVTNDASLLLPVNTWTGNYLVAAWQHWSSYPGFYSVTASQDNTAVTLKAPKGGVPTQAGAGVDAQGNGVVMLNEGDVLQVMTANGGDLTGSIIAADKPVQVLGGHDCTQVPIGVTACDHLEESMFPVEALAKKYIIVPPVQVPNANADKALNVRIVASEPNTTLTFEPDQPVAKVLANAGDFVEMAKTTAKFVVTADKKILVAQYMVGQGANFGTSDPAMVLAVPSEQYRTSYLFYAQTGWQANYVDIIAPDGSAVKVDGADVNNFAPIGASGFSIAHVKLSNAGDGTHDVIADKKVGISVYGVVNYGSYWYPGGLDLDLIPQ